MLWKNYGKAMEFLFLGSVRTLYIVRFCYFVKLKAAFVHNHFLLGVELKRIVLSGYFLTISLCNS